MEQRSLSKSIKPQDPANKTDDDSEDEKDLCFICTEPMVTCAVSACDHRTCHLCALRLRALYGTRHCAYCKTEQATVIFTTDTEKAFAEYVIDHMFADKALDARFETKQIYQEALRILEYNCPVSGCREVCENGWPDLKVHIKKSHDLLLCDLCTRHKKVFSHEHTLYTVDQLDKHHREGTKAVKQDEAGFLGHPECQFCRMRFYGDDELFEHCRDKHEQCHICVRQGVRHEYYADYNRLESHFRRSHFLCLRSQCLEKKFVVFESEIDMKAHEVEVHGASMANLQRAQKSEARRIDINFEYADSPRRRTTDRVRESNRQPDTRSSTSATLPEEPSSSRAPPPAPERTVPGAPKKAKQQLFQKPKGFGGLSSSDRPTADATVSRHAAFLAKLGEMFKSAEKVAQFRTITTAYRNSSISVDTYIDDIISLCNHNTQQASIVFEGVEALMDNDDKKMNIAKTWHSRKNAAYGFEQLQNFPVLVPAKSKKPVASPSRVLVIKDKTTRIGTGKAKAGKVAPINPRGTIPVSNPSSVQRTAWAGNSGNSSSSSSSSTSGRSDSKISPSSGPSQPRSQKTNAKDFPTLPTAAPKHPIVLNMRRNKIMHDNAWTSKSGTTKSESADIVGKQKKGRKNKQVLFRVGL
ncbi:hypothetical protein DFQ28_008084 [Apophysomyces sp. BC1034]|nr:hypothetical protein DFQ28_008084 [Apophysomyces sp. BC1034]